MSRHQHLGNPGMALVITHTSGHYFVYLHKLQSIEAIGCGGTDLHAALEFARGCAAGINAITEHMPKVWIGPSIWKHDRMPYGVNEWPLGEFDL
jgi:hypothetical protein